MQSTLRKQKLNISLTNPDGIDDSIYNADYLATLLYTLADGTVIDLLKHSGVKEHANRYVTSLMDVIFKREELVNLETKDVIKDDRYQLLKEAVRSKFRLPEDELETIWIWLHNVILAKRRTIIGKARKGIAITHDTANNHST
ncbi:unnamed protein product [Adineta ricciae]|uniref:Uncharacterized protein n=2 Tax=Adineta ricciae TaxID=249248 RepID=A0A815G4Y2_ADIRI|nr:unnamed protein product [Adineta ricciae]